jgi:Recombination endonuclease VII
MSKICKKCNKVKSRKKFAYKKAAKDKLQSWCNRCVRKYNRHWFSKVSDKTKRKYAKNFKLKHPDYHKNYDRDRVYARYEITEKQYNKLLKLQKGRCAICENTKGDSIRDHLHIDHDHSIKDSKVIRGLLCANCNMGLGKFKESIELLRKAVKYLKHPPNEKQSIAAAKPQ